MKKIFLFFSEILTLLICQSACACPMCKEIISNQKDASLAAKLTGGFAWSLGLLLATPYLLFAGLTFWIVRSARRRPR